MSLKAFNCCFILLHVRQLQMFERYCDECVMSSIHVGLQCNFRSGTGDLSTLVEFL